MGVRREIVVIPVSDVDRAKTFYQGLGWYAQYTVDEPARQAAGRLAGPGAVEVGEWMQQATLAIRARVPLDVLRDVTQPFPTFSEIYVAALKALRAQITAARHPAGAGSP